MTRYLESADYKTTSIRHQFPSLINSTTSMRIPHERANITQPHRYYRHVVSSGQVGSIVPVAQDAALRHLERFNAYMLLPT